MTAQNEKLIVALDIGTTKIACIVGKKNNYGKLEIIAIGREESHGVMRGMVSNIDKTVESIEKAVSQAEAKAGIKIKNVHVGIAGQHIRSLQHRGILTRNQPTQEIGQIDINRLVDDMHKLALDPGERIIHVLPQEYIVDNEQGIKEPIGMCGSRLEANFHIITGQVAAAQNIEKCVSKAGLKMSSLILEPLASAAAVLDDEEKEAGVALVDIGGGTTDIAIFQDGIIRHTSVIPFGGNIITEDIKEGCLVMKKQAEALKVRFGSALAMETQENEIISIPGLKGREPKEISVRNLAHIIQARVEEIFEQVFFEVRSSGFANKLIGGIVLTGGGSQLKHIKQLVEFSTGFDTRIGYPTEHLSKSEVDHIKHPMFSTGVGLLINGDEETVADEQPELQEMESSEESDAHQVEDKTQPQRNWWKQMIDKADQFFQEEID